eukprot:6637073-Pyramimonas_sp.AAC.1
MEEDRPSVADQGIMSSSSKDRSASRHDVEHDRLGDSQETVQYPEAEQEQPTIDYPAPQAPE